LKNACSHPYQEQALSKAASEPNRNGLIREPELDRGHPQAGNRKGVYEPIVSSFLLTSLLPSEVGERTLLVDLDPKGAAGFYFRMSPTEKFKARMISARSV
jgi:hypothetical protein